MKIKKFRLLFVCCMTFPLFSFAEPMTVRGRPMELMGGVDKEYAVLIDSQSVRRNRGNVLYWEIRYYATPQTSPVEKKLFQIGKTMFRGDCSNWTFTPIAGAFYTQDDKLVDQMNLPPSFQEAGNVVPGSYAEQEMKFLCK